MPKRKYTKKSEYWDKFKSKDLNELIQETRGVEEDWNPSLEGEAYYAQSSLASYERTGEKGSSETSRTKSRFNGAAVRRKPWKYANIQEGSLPYHYHKSGCDIREAIMLCQKAYANIPIFRNVVDIMSEFANTELHLEGGTEKSRTFIDKWMQKIKIWSIKDQYFREYYRSGNIFMYRLDTKFSSDDFNRMSTIYGSEFIKPGEIPIRYIMLNPYDIATVKSASFDGQVYRKVLSEFELERLKEPKTEYDKEVLNGLSEKDREAIKKGRFGRDGIFIQLDPHRLLYSFYKKQDYEPFAIPFGYPVLDDLNWKLELKKVDQAVTRTIENVILLITMGNTPDNGGINPHNLKAMQSLFSNESVGRVLVSDYTTKAEFIIPDLNRVLGPEKYQIVDQDIKEALQNVVVGHERYSNTQVKAQIFLERLKEARNTFINEFLQPQIKLVCQNLGFRKYPTVRFQEIDLKDEVQLQRVTTRLMELGILTPEQGIQTIKTGIYPENREIGEGQEGYLEDRQKGLYSPLVGGQPLPLSEEEKEEQMEMEQMKIDHLQKIDKENSPNNPAVPNKATPNEEGRPSGSNTKEKTAFADRKGIQSTIYSTEQLFSFAQKEMKANNGIKRLSKQKKELLNELCKTVITSSSKNDWEKIISMCIKDFNKIESLSILPQISEIAREHDMELYPSALYYHSKKDHNDSQK
tara:strand:- start:3384 stop:5462 length:2079 start_codon:yes stop_codon:yes gene_type:complete